MYRDDAVDPPRLVCQVGSTTLPYDARCIDDLTAMLREADDWVCWAELEHGPRNNQMRARS